MHREAVQGTVLGRHVGMNAQQGCSLRGKGGTRPHPVCQRGGWIQQKQREPLKGMVVR